MTTVTENRTSLTATRQVGRFTLTDLAEERYGCQVWRAVDGTLNREVALWIVPRDEQLETDLEQATRAAAAITDRRVLRTLDLFTTETDVVIVVEWCDAAVLRDHLSEPLTPEEAARIAYELTGALESAHAAGIVHGRLRPSNVLVGPDGEIRITGLGIDAVLAGIDPVPDGQPITADVAGVGAILYASLTGRWPNGTTEGIAGAPLVGGHIPPPSRLLADIPESLDDICARTVPGIVAPRGRPVLTSMAALHDLLGASLTDLAGAPRRREPGQSGPLIARIVMIVGVALLALGLILVLLKLLSPTQASVSGDDQPPVAAPVQTPAATPGGTPPPATKVYRIASARDFDPLGNGEESPTRVPLSYDGDKETAWRTVTYYDKGLDNKPGVGLLLDLGAPRSIGAVTLDLVGNGTDLQVLTSNQAGNNPQDYTVMAQATEAGRTVTLKNPEPTSARYVLVWLTGLPQVDGGWRGGIREVTVTN